jgi:hypothetical protein
MFGKPFLHYCGKTKHLNIFLKNYYKLLTFFGLKRDEYLLRSFISSRKQYI